MTSRSRPRRTLALLLLSLTACSQARLAPPAEGHAEAHETRVAGLATRASTREVIRDAQLTLETKTPTTVRDQLEQVAVRAGGYLSEMHTEGLVTGASIITMTLRVPEPRLQDVIARTRRVANVTNEAMGSEDVTDQRLDLGARAIAQQKLEARLLALAEHQGSLDEILRMEQELARVRTGIEALQAQERQLAGRSSLASLTVSIQRPFMTAMWPNARARFTEAWHDALELSVTCVVAGLRIASLLPPALALLALYLMTRRAFRRWPTV